MPARNDGALQNERRDANRFDLHNQEAYRRWRDAKLATYPRDINDLLVELAGASGVTAAERAAIVARCNAFNMALYVSRTLSADDGKHRRFVLDLGRRLDLSVVEDHRSRDEDGLVRIELASGDSRDGYIPYTNRPIAWHTDGYYNFHGADRAVLSMILHCARPGEGGENGLLDHEIAYIRLRDEDPGHIEALMDARAMTIPTNIEANGAVRPANVGPVFFVEPRTGRLSMRYTARTRSIEWRDDPRTRAAAAALARILAEEPLVLRARLAAGMGLVCNNVLHDRTGFVSPSQGGRLLYRIRYHNLVH